MDAILKAGESHQRDSVSLTTAHPVVTAKDVSRNGPGLLGGAEILAGRQVVVAVKKELLEGRRLISTLPTQVLLGRSCFVRVICSPSLLVDSFVNFPIKTNGS